MKFTPISPQIVACLAAVFGFDRDQGAASGKAPTVIFRDTDGRTLTVDDLRGVTGTFRYEIIGSGAVPAEANLLHQQARQAGAAGDFEKALALLAQASKLAPQWPYPIYDTAYTYLLMGDFDRARQYYRKTVELAPRGFFTALIALDTLERERAGDLASGTYLAYLSLEWLDDGQKKATAVRRLTEQVPRFAPAWLQLAKISAGGAERLEAVEKGLTAEPDAETKGELLCNKALLLNRQGDHEGAVQLLGKLALDVKSTYSTEQMAKAALAMLTKE
jgi:tetratricopeptide (TPR) repeat protein